MVYTFIKDRILSGDLAPGERLHIGSIAKDFQISEIPVREALQVLESEKLVTIIPHTGAIVAPISAKDLHEILELRVYLESLATFLAAPYFTDADFEELEKNLKKQEFCIAMEELGEFGEINREFHRLIYQKNPNKRLNEIIYNLWDHSKRYRTVFRNNKEFTIGSFEEHRKIVQLLREGKAAEAQELMYNHKVRSAKEIKKKWKLDTVEAGKETNR
ncbi:GntR family transcriptional regulator [Bacillaceae bacterium]